MNNNQMSDYIKEVLSRPEEYWIDLDNRLKKSEYLRRTIALANHWTVTDFDEMEECCCQFGGGVMFATKIGQDLLEKKDTYSHTNEGGFTFVYPYELGVLYAKEMIWYLQNQRVQFQNGDFSEKGWIYNELKSKSIL